MLSSRSVDVGAVERAPRMTPCSRKAIVNARVSTPLSAGIPYSASHRPSGASARHELGSSAIWRASTARTCGREDSASAAFTPTFPIWGQVKTTICPQ